MMMLLSCCARRAILRSAAVIGIALASAGAYGQTAPAGKTTLTVYTSLQKEVLVPYQEAFQKAHPDIEIGWVRDAGGVIHSRLLAERDNPRADVIFGLPVTDILSLYNEGLIEPYAPKGSDKLKKHFKDTRVPQVWTGIDMYLNIICFNTVEAKQRNLPRPAHWADLADPVYKGQVSMPDPAISNTGYGYVSHWVQTMGEAEAWKFMDALHENIAIYTSSSSTPCKFASTGEYAVGLSTDLTAPQLKSKGAPIDIVIPSEKTAWDVESMALLKGSRKPEAAKTLLDWGASREANEQYIRFIGSVAMPDLANKPPPNSLQDGDAMAADLDLQWSIDNRTRLIAEWSRRYAAKSEAKAK
ncbi:MAG: extracellular solute-binding protein [Alphaproteobacteria bacterium]